MKKTKSSTETKKTRGRPTKLLTWIEAFKKVVNEDINAIILTDDELRMLTNDLVEEKQQVADRTFESWTAGGVLIFCAFIKKHLLFKKRTCLKSYKVMMINGRSMLG